jgi:hypothetical protein
MRSKIGMAAALLVAFAASAAAQSDTSGPSDAEAAVQQLATAEADASAREEPKICRTRKATGSLTRRNRICLTQAQ